MKGGLGGGARVQTGENSQGVGWTLSLRKADPGGGLGNETLRVVRTSKSTTLSGNKKIGRWKTKGES